MNRTKYIPPLVMLAGGFCACVITILREFTTKEILLITSLCMVVMLIIGFVFRFIAEMFVFKEEKQEEEEQAEEGNVEETSTEDEKQSEAKEKE